MTKGSKEKKISRRDFLRMALLAGGGAGLAALAPKEKMQAESQPGNEKAVRLEAKDIFPSAELEMQGQQCPWLVLDSDNGQKRVFFSSQPPDDAVLPRLYSVDFNADPDNASFAGPVQIEGVSELHQHHPYISGARLPDGRTLAIINAKVPDDNSKSIVKAVVIDADNQAHEVQSHQLDNARFGTTAISLNPGTGRFSYAVRGEDGKVEIWDFNPDDDSCTKITSLAKPPSETITGLAFNYNGRIIVTASQGSANGEQRNVVICSKDLDAASETQFVLAGAYFPSCPEVVYTWRSNYLVAYVNDAGHPCCVLYDQGNNTTKTISFDNIQAKLNNSSQTSPKGSTLRLFCARERAVGVEPLWAFRFIGEDNIVYQVFIDKNGEISGPIEQIANESVGGSFGKIPDTIARTTDAGVVLTTKDESGTPSEESDLKGFAASENPMATPTATATERPTATMTVTITPTTPLPTATATPETESTPNSTPTPTSTPTEEPTPHIVSLPVIERNWEN